MHFSHWTTSFHRPGRVQSTTINSYCLIDFFSCAILFLIVIWLIYLFVSYFKIKTRVNMSKKIYDWRIVSCLICPSIDNYEWSVSIDYLMFHGHTKKWLRFNFPSWPMMIYYYSVVHDRQIVLWKRKTLAFVWKRTSNIVISHHYISVIVTQEWNIVCFNHGHYHNHDIFYFYESPIKSH